MDSQRLRLEPLTVAHAVEMVDVLGFTSIYEYIGGEPPSFEDLQSRYTRQSVGHSDDDAQGWLNWIIRHRDSGAAIGFVQATLQRLGTGMTADVAWVVAPPYQGHGYASEAAEAMARWLRAHGVKQLVAYVHPDHQASINVARHLGLHATNIRVDGETRWES